MHIEKIFHTFRLVGAFSEKKSESKEYAKMYMGLQNKVEQIEENRRENFMKEMELI